MLEVKAESVSDGMPVTTVKATGAVNIQLVLPPPLVLLAPANLRGAALFVTMLVMETKSMLIYVPLVLDTVVVEADERDIVINLPLVPFTLKFVRIVVVEPPANCSVRAFVTSLKLMVSKLLLPVIARVPVDPATVYVSVPNVLPFPANVRVFADAALITIVELAALTVVFANTVSKMVPAAVELSVSVVAPSVNVLAIDPVKANVGIVTAYPEVSSVPALMVNVPVLVQAPPSVYVPNAPKNIFQGVDVLFVLIV